MPSLCFVASLLVGTAVGSAITGTPYWNPSLSQSSWPTAATSSCLSGPQATSIVAKFESLLTGPQAPSFNATASALLANDFADTSDSIDSLAGYPLGSVTFPSKQAFIIGQGAQPPIPNIMTLDIFFTCSKVAWRWVAQGIGSGIAEVKGIDIFTVTPAGQISEVYSEFNSAAWLADIGNPECQT